MEFFLFYLLHKKIVFSRIDEELTALMTRGNNHRDVLETYYNDETLHHIALMEVKSDSDVIITNKKGEILINSKIPNDDTRKILNQNNSVPRIGRVVEDDWKSHPFISTVTPFSTQSQDGFVYMFKDTGKIKSLINQLNRHFLIAGIATTSITALIIMILSRIVTMPLIKMKIATKKLSEGNFSIKLEYKNKDEIGELAESIQTLANELNHLKTERNEFLGSISHELRTPLSYIKGYAEVVKREELSHKERIEYLNIINEETSQLTNLVNDLMTLARLDKNTFVINKEKISLSSILSKISSAISPAFHQKKGKLQIICKNDVLLFADPTRLEQIIMNLLDNARKYSYERTITTIKAQQNSVDLKIYVSDEGIGIPQNELPYIFERFYRVDKSRSREFGGSGVGLSIVKELIEAHGWEIDVESIPNKGTTFIITVKEL